MAKNACVRSRKGHGDWIGQTSIWSDPRAQLDNTAVEIQPEPAPVAKPANTNTVTEKQMSFLKSLIAARITSTNEATAIVAQGIRFAANQAYKEGRLSKAVASQLIQAISATAK